MVSDYQRREQLKLTEQIKKVCDSSISALERGDMTAYKALAIHEARLMDELRVRMHADDEEGA